MNELLPCPFCGGEAKAADGWATGWYGYQVGCDSCDFYIVRHGGDEKEVKEKVAKLWNTRTEMSYEDVKILFDELGLSERTCHIEGRYGNKYCTCCGEMVGTWDSTSELYVSGNMVELWNYCPNCGAKVVGE